jgi:hypothetical protein
MRWIGAALALQLIGYVFDVVWHAMLRPGAEPATFGEMARHLASVHLPLYIGAAMVLVSTVVELLRRRRRRPVGNALPIAVTGAVISCGAEGWHALSHLVSTRMRRRSPGYCRSSDSSSSWLRWSSTSAPPPVETPTPRVPGGRHEPGMSSKTVGYDERTTWPDSNRRPPI